MSLPLFRTPLPQTRQIRFWACLIGYAVALLGVPFLARQAVGLAHLLPGALLVSASGEGTVGDLFGYLAFVVQALGKSTEISWMGALLSVPVVVWAQHKGWFGFGTAMLTGIGVLVPVAFGMLDGNLEETAVLTLYLALPSALLGLAFWITVRVICPGAFRQ